MSIQDFQTRFPEFSSEEGDRVTLFMADAELIMSANDGRWLDFYDVALSYLTAHLMTLGNSSAAGDFGAVSPIKKQEVDDVIVESAVSSRPYDADMLSSTTYGSQYLMYRRMCFAGIYGV